MNQDAGNTRSTCLRTWPLAEVAFVESLLRDVSCRDTDNTRRGAIGILRKARPTRFLVLMYVGFPSLKGKNISSEVSRRMTTNESEDCERQMRESTEPWDGYKGHQPKPKAPL